MRNIVVLSGVDGGDCIREIEHFRAECDHLYIVSQKKWGRTPLSRRDGFSIITDTSVNLYRVFDIPVHDDDVIIFASLDYHFPANYIQSIKSKLYEYRDSGAIIGIAGKIYPDIFFGDRSSILEYDFQDGLNEDTFVNEISRDACACFGWQLPPIDRAAAAGSYLNVAWALSAHEKGITKLCMQRPSDWIVRKHPRGDDGAAPDGKYDAPWTRAVIEFGGLRNLPG